MQLEHSYWQLPQVNAHHGCKLRSRPIYVTTAFGSTLSGLPYSPFCVSRTNCKSTCYLCDMPAAPLASATPAEVPSPSQTSHLPLAYASNTLSRSVLSPSPCSFSCVDIPPPSSPYTCAEQVSMLNATLPNVHAASKLEACSCSYRKALGIVILYSSPHQFLDYPRVTVR